MKNKIKQFPVARGLTQQQLGVICGTTHGTIRRLEIADRPPSEKWAILLAEAFSVSRGELFDISGNSEDGVSQEPDFKLEVSSGTAERFGANIRRLREAKGWSQRDIATAIGVSGSAIGLWEQGRNEPPLHVLVYYSRLFRVSVDELLGVNGTSSRPPKLEMLISQ